MKRFFASMPQHHPVMAHNVLCHQRSSKPPHDIRISSVPTHGKNGKIVHQRNEFDDQNNIHPYVDTVVMSLHSHMDVQCTDGYSMLLQYVSSYVTKMHDDFICDDLYNVDIDSRNAAYRYVMGTPPTEPEMWLSLSDMKFVHHSGKTKRFTIPRFVDVLSNRWTQQYLKRSPDKHHLSMLQLHRLCVTSAEYCHLYTINEQASVACKMVSPWNTEFLWQHTLINMPFCSYQDLLPPDFEQVPDLLQHYAVALHANPQLWTCNDAIEQVLHRRSLKKHQIATYLSFVQTLHDTYNCWSKKLLSNEDFLVWDETRTDSDCCVLAAMQKLLLAIIMQRDRLQHYVPDLP